MGVERVHESAEVLPGTEELKRRASDGWKLVALVWERGSGAAHGPHEDIPYGLKVSDDCEHLVENPDERKVLHLAMDQIVQDQPLSRVAEVLNAKGYRTRNGAPWSPVSVFELLPRLIDAGPGIFNSREWIHRRATARA